MVIRATATAPIITAIALGRVDTQSSGRVGGIVSLGGHLLPPANVAEQVKWEEGLRLGVGW